MHTHRIEVLDRADDHDVVGVVAHDLELELFPTHDRLLDEDLRDRARGQAPFGDGAHLVRRVGEAGATTAEDERCPHDERVADLLGDLHGVAERGGEA